MKNLFKKLSVLMLSVFTLASCSRPNKNTVSFAYGNLTELETNLKEATLYGDKKVSGAYVFNTSNETVKPDDIKIKFYSGVEKEDRDNITKQNLKINLEEFVIEMVISFNTKDGKKTDTYTLHTRSAFDTDIYDEVVKESEKHKQDKNYKPKKTFGVLKGSRQLYKDLKYTCAIAVNDVDDSGKITDSNTIMYVCSSIDYTSTQSMATKLLANLKYIQLGK